MGRPRIYTDEQRKQRARDNVKRWTERNKEAVAAYQRNYRVSSPERYAASLLAEARRRAQSHGTAFDLDVEWFSENYERGCAVTGRAFELSPEGRTPWGPSLDQIDPGSGYTKENTRLVCMIYNFAKHTWTDEVVKDFATLVASIP
jgi:hypothetical protein